MGSSGSDQVASGRSVHPLIATVRDFVDRYVLPTANGPTAETEFPHALVQQMRELGLFGTIVPQAYGGLGLDTLTHAAIMEEIARGWFSLSGVLNTHTLCSALVLSGGTDGQRSDLLPRLASGALRGAFSLTEPHAGSDVQAIEARGVREQDGSWSLHGRKRWITNGLGAGVVFVLVKTDPTAEPAYAGMTCFIVEKEPFAATNTGRFAGVTISEVIEKMGDRGVDTTDLVLEGYRCCPDRILGEEAGLGLGFTQMLSAMEVGRVGAASLCVGLAQRSFEVALDYARTRETFGKPIAEHQAIQFKLADMATKIEAARLLTRNAAAAKDAGRRSDLEAGMAKLFASEAAKEVAEDSFRIHGSNGYSKQFEIERLYRDTLCLLSAEGPSEIQRMVIGRQIVAGR
ncbi:(2S)-methylsuccinyl-CoA dehydrogenase [Mesorhizobium australicum]|uniref:(2S)-methylsuccinyl-CoA dehydrogenase n=1 Tax=Mesorhizobium australicum TaxID=536018 RepID=A0A1X7NF61_9HYPH|nr:(2S)-methylsuccinyl-CoA dehydrogenase [Mesorhizobium australicum]